MLQDQRRRSARPLRVSAVLEPPRDRHAALASIQPLESVRQWFIVYESRRDQGWARRTAPSVERTA